MFIAKSFVDTWCLADLSADAVRLDASGVSVESFVEREETVVVFTPPMRKRLKAFFWKCFTDYITVQTGLFHNCCISECLACENIFHLLRTNEKNCCS